MSRVIRRRPVVLVAFAAIVLIAVLAVVLSGGSGRPDFRVGDETASSADGEGLMGGRRQASQRVFDPDVSRSAAIVERTGPGSTVLGFRTLVLDGDAQPVRIRQRTSEDLSDGRRGGPVRWQGYVAVQGEQAGRTISDAVGPWRPAGREGIVVRPGQQVRLRTRYDLQGRRGAKACRSTILADGPRWEVREGDGPWELLRARDDAGRPDGEQRDVEVRTGQVGALAFTSARPCDLSGSVLNTITGDGTRPADELDLGGL